MSIKIEAAQRLSAAKDAASSAQPITGVNKDKILNATHFIELDMELVHKLEKALKDGRKYPRAELSAILKELNIKKRAKELLDAVYMINYSD